MLEVEWLGGLLLSPGICHTKTQTSSGSLLFSITSPCPSAEILRARVSDAKFTRDWFRP